MSSRKRDRSPHFLGSSAHTTMSQSRLTSPASALSEQQAKDVETLFRKRFEYSALDVSQLPGRTGACHQITVEDVVGEEPTVLEFPCVDRELMEVKRELNALKDQLSVKDIETWHRHTTQCNLSAKIIPFVKSLDVELCTQAWAKFYEIVTAHPQLVPDGKFLSVHLCEAPGAFIASLNHFLQLNAFHQQWDWRATTLNPYCEANSVDSMVADDRLIRQTYPKWYFGPDGSGDLLRKGHVEGLCELVSDLRRRHDLPVLLVTADGSKDCQSNPAEQESLVSQLHYSEVLTACQLLAPSGCLVVKMFTLLESCSVVLMFLLNLMFSKVNVMKPATSKGGNSEVYVVCLHYKGNVREETLKKLIEKLVYNTSTSQVLSLPPLPSSFLHDHRHCCQKFAGWQKETIRRNLDLFEHRADPARFANLLAVQTAALQEFLSTTRLRACRQVVRLCPVLRQAPSFQLKLCPSAAPGKQQCAALWGHKYLKGTFQLRQNLSHMAFTDTVQLMKPHGREEPSMVLTSRHSLEEDMSGWQWGRLETSAFSPSVNNSRFCDVEVFQDFRTLWDNSQFQTCRQQTVAQHCTDLVKHLTEIISTLNPNCPQDNKPVANMTAPWPPTNSPRPCTCLLYCDKPQREASEVRQTFVQALEKTDTFSVHCVRSPDCVNNVDCGQGEETFKCVDGVFECGQLFSDMTSFLDDPGGGTDSPVLEEVGERQAFLSKMLFLLKRLPLGGDLVLLTSTFLTRLTAGYLYVLARCFQQTSIKSVPNVWLHQFVVLEGFCGFGPLLWRKLETVESLLRDEEGRSQTGNCVMGILDTTYLLSDRKFVQFVTAYNNYTVANFVDLMLDHHQHKPKGESEQGLTDK